MTVAAPAQSPAPRLALAGVEDDAARIAEPRAVAQRAANSHGAFRCNSLADCSFKVDPRPTLMVVRGGSSASSVPLSFPEQAEYSRIADVAATVEQMRSIGRECRERKSG
jgi:hypothetical protein